jgi:hypothetical protein
VEDFDVLAMSPSTPFGDGNENDPPSIPDDPPLTPADPPERQCTPPPRKRSSPFILFSPSKKDKFHVHADDNDDNDDEHL